MATEIVQNKRKKDRKNEQGVPAWVAQLVKRLPSAQASHGNIS